MRRFLCTLCEQISDADHMDNEGNSMTTIENYMRIKVIALYTAICNVQVKNQISVFQPCALLGFSEVLQYLMVDDQ